MPAHDVVGLEVAVDDFAAVDEFEDGEEAAQEVFDFGFAEFAFFVEFGLEGLANDEFLDEIEVVVFLEVGEQARDLRVYELV